MRGWSLLLIAVVACGDEDAPTEEEPITAPDEVLEGPDEGEDPEPVEWELHEWGLIDVDLADRTLELAAGPGRANPSAAPTKVGAPVMQPAPPTPPAMRPAMRPAGRRKPVLYFHVPDGAELDVDLSVHLGQGHFVEHWPTATLDAQTLSWSVHLSSGHCAASSYPSVDDDACQQVSDGYCELAELSGYVADDSDCANVDGAPHPFLFYRGDGQAPELPVTVERDGATLVLSNTSLPGGNAVFRLRRQANEVHASRVTMPAEGESLRIDAPTLPATDVIRNALGEELQRLGLTRAEAAAFERAWSAELFDGESNTPKAFVDALVFFLPQDAIDPYARLEAEPAPTTVRRAMAVRAGWTE